MSIEIFNKKSSNFYIKHVLTVYARYSIRYRLNTKLSSKYYTEGDTAGVGA
jgi:hypothetical protein